MKSALTTHIKRHVISACLFMFLLSYVTAFSFAGVQAVELNKNAAISVVDPAGRTYQHMQLLDGRYTTKLTLPAHTEICIQTEQRISGLYLIWDRAPGPWALRVVEEERTSMVLLGTNGWIHEYVALEEPSCDISIMLSNREATLCEIGLFGEGDLPEYVQVWDEPYADADMLLLPTHADDEHLFFGGIMPYYAGERGYKVQVAYLTNHWAEPYRPHELLNGLWEVGIRNYPIIGEFIDYYADNLEYAKGLYNPDRVVEYQVELIRRFRPEVIIGHDIGGEYGHGVHMLNTWALMQAIDLAADEAYRTTWDGEQETFRVSKVYLHLYPDRAVTMNWDKPLSRFGGRTALDMAKAGFAQHISQQKWFSVRTEGVHDCRAFGLYDTVVGDDPDWLEPDFFHNIEHFSDDAPRMDANDDNDITTDDSNSPDNARFPVDGRGLRGAGMISVGVVLIFIALIVWARSRTRS